MDLFLARRKIIMAAKGWLEEVISLTGYKTQTITLQAGNYMYEIAGAGGTGASYSGGFLSGFFLLTAQTRVKCMSSETSWLAYGGGGGGVPPAGNATGNSGGPGLGGLRGSIGYGNVYSGSNGGGTDDGTGKRYGGQGEGVTTSTSGATSATTGGGGGGYGSGGGTGGAGYGGGGGTVIDIEESGGQSRRIFIAGGGGGGAGGYPSGFLNGSSGCNNFDNVVGGGAAPGQDGWLKIWRVFGKV